jgi:hypothetical protein
MRRISNSRLLRERCDMRSASRGPTVLNPNIAGLDDGEVCAATDVPTQEKKQEDPDGPKLSRASISHRSA